MEKQTPEPSHGDFVSPPSHPGVPSCHSGAAMEATDTSTLTGTRPHSAKDTHGKLTLNSGIGKSHWERPTSQLLVFNIPNGLSLLLLN